MILGTQLLTFVFSSEGLTLTLGASALWTLSSRQRLAPRIFLLAAAVFYGAAGSFALAHAGAAWLARPFEAIVRADVPPGRTAVVLLGAGVATTTDWSGRSHSVLSLPAAERTLEAARVFTLLDPDWIISSGGNPDPNDPDQPSGVAMRETLLQLGVPADRIVVEQQSRTTRDEAVIVSGILKSLGAEHVVLVTSAIHMRRSLAVFHSKGVQAIPAVARGTLYPATGATLYLPSSAGLSLSHDVAHEILGMLYYRLRGWQQ